MKSQPSYSPEVPEPVAGSVEPTSSLRRVTMTTRTGLVHPEAGQFTADAYIGATIDGRYEVESVIGEGGMGVVYRCRHTIIGKKVAMKVLRADMARSEEVVGRFLNEARSASSIGNPHIIDISDFGRLPDGATYFIMEYLEGTSLSGAAEHGPPPLDRVGSIAIQLAEALGAAHEAGIVHRDLKPENIFLVRRGSHRDFVKVLDFGIAKVQSDSTSGRFTQAGQVFGTPHYMSPEQAAGTVVDHRADIYAVGVILYELVTGRLPFDAETFMGILSQHMYKDPEPPSTLIQFQRLDPDLERVILCCLQKNPDDRYQHMSDLESDLRLIFGDPVVSSRELRASALSAPAIQVAPHRRRWILWSALGVVAAASAGAAWLHQTGEWPRTFPARPNLQQRPEKSVVAPAPPPPAAPRLVAVAVEPLSAHVFRGEQDLGSSPVMIELGDQPIQLVAKATGYLPQAFLVDGTLTTISVKLEPLAPPVKALPPRPAARPAQRPAAKSAGSGSKKSSEGSGELVNPWE